MKAIREASLQAVHHFTQADQVHQLVSASEADPDLGFMARLMELCSLPRTNPGNRKEYVRRNGPYKLGMTAGIDNKLPYGTIPRLLLAWVSTEAVRTQSRELILGRSLSEFMRKLNIYSTSGGSRGDRTRLRNQQRQSYRPQLPTQGSPRVEEDQAGLAGAELHNGPWSADPASLESLYPTGAATFAHGVALLAARLASDGLWRLQVCLGNPSLKLKQLYIIPELSLANAG